MTSSKPDKFPKSTGVQRKYLRERMDAVHWSRHDFDEPEPKEVRDARKVIDAWTRRERDNKHKHNATFERARERAREAILFASAEDALQLVVEFEQLVERHNRGK